MSKRIKGITIEIGGDVQPLNKALEDVNKKSRNLQQELRQVDRLLKLDPKNTELIAQKQKLLAEAVTTTKDKLDTLKEAERQAQEQFKKGEIGEEQYRALQREVVKTEQELKRLEKQARESGMSIEQLGKKLGEAGKKMTDMGKTLTTRLTAPIVGAGVAAMKMASDFEDSLAKVSTLADDTQVSMEDLKRGILDISTTSGIASTEIAGSVYDALSAGVETGKVLEYVEANIMLTKAGFTDMGVAVDATSTVLNAYGDAAFDVMKIGDILVKTQDEGKITVDELGKSMGRVIPTASSLGVNLDQLGAAYAIMTAKGQNSQIATTNLNSMLGELGKTGSKTDKALREITKKSFKDLVAGGSSVGDILGLLDDYAKKAGLSLADMFGSTTAGSAALTLVSGGVDAFNSKVDIMNNATGTMAANVEKLLTPSEEMKIALNKLKNAAIEFGVMLMPIMSKLAGWLTKLADKMGSMDDKTRKAIIVIGGIVAAIGPLLMILGSMATGLSAIIGFVGPLISGIGGLTVGLGGLGAAAGGAAAGIGAILGPALLVVGAITAVTAGAVALVKHLRKDVIPEVDLFADHVEYSTDKVTGEMKRMTHTISDTTKEAVGAYMDLDDKAQKSLLNLHLRSTEITGEIKDDMVGQYKEMNTQLVAGMEKRKEEEIDLLRQTLNETGALTAQEARKALKDAEEHWSERIKETEGYQEEISRIFDRAARERREITENEYDRILELQEEMKNESIRILSENEVEAGIILNRMKDYDGKITAETMAEHIKEINDGRDKAVAAAEDEYDRRVGAYIRLRDETKSITAAQADKMIEEAKRTRDEAIEEAEDMRLGVLDKMRGMNKDLDKEVDTTTGNILNNWDKLKRWWSGWKPETKKIEVQQPAVQQMGSLGRTPQYASGTSYHPGGAAIVGEVGPELVNLPRGSQVIPLSGGGLKSEVRHSGTITVRGVSDQGQLVGVVDAVIERLIAEVRA